MGEMQKIVDAPPAGLPEPVVEILARHQKFARGRAAGGRANLAFVDFCGAALKGLHLQSLVAPGANFSRCDLSKTDFRFADLFGANLESTNCTGANFGRSDLRGVRMQGATLIKANFREADLRPGFLVRNAAGKRGEITYSRVGGADLADARLDGADLGGARLDQSNLVNGSFIETNLENASLAGANLAGSDMRCANLVGAKLKNAKLAGVDFTGADLRGAMLCGANMVGAKVVGANLQGADMSGAILTADQDDPNSPVSKRHLAELGELGAVAMAMARGLGDCAKGNLSEREERLFVSKRGISEDFACIARVVRQIITLEQEIYGFRPLPQKRINAANANAPADKGNDSDILKGHRRQKALRDDERDRDDLRHYDPATFDGVTAKIRQALGVGPKDADGATPTPSPPIVKAGQDTAIRKNSIQDMDDHPAAQRATDCVTQNAAHQAAGSTHDNKKTLTHTPPNLVPRQPPDLAFRAPGNFAPPSGSRRRTHDPP